MSTWSAVIGVLFSETKGETCSPICSAHSRQPQDKSSNQTWATFWSSNICICRVRRLNTYNGILPYRPRWRGRYFIPTVIFVIIIILWQTRPFPLESFLRHIPGDRKENPVYFQSRELILGSARTRETGTDSLNLPTPCISSWKKDRGQLTKFYSHSSLSLTEFLFGLASFLSGPASEQVKMAAVINHTPAPSSDSPHSDFN